MAPNPGPNMINPTRNPAMKRKLMSQRHRGLIPLSLDKINLYLKIDASLVNINVMLYMKTLRREQAEHESDHAL